mmetsp:Transcript_3574/g.8492  ORF Transcript_3574/g.8492 Transcript_3574/m.8492 type:complete len:242 (-) Transcript_3574:19-744(-)
MSSTHLNSCFSQASRNFLHSFSDHSVFFFRRPARQKKKQQNPQEQHTRSARMTATRGRGSDAGSGVVVVSVETGSGVVVASGEVVSLAWMPSAVVVVSGLTHTPGSVPAHPTRVAPLGQLSHTRQSAFSRMVHGAASHSDSVQLMHTPHAAALASQKSWSEPPSQIRIDIDERHEFSDTPQFRAMTRRSWSGTILPCIPCKPSKALTTVTSSVWTFTTTSSKATLLKATLSAWPSKPSRRM